MQSETQRKNFMHDREVLSFCVLPFFNPFAPGDSARHFAEKRVLKLVEWFSGHCRAVKS